MPITANWRAQFRMIDRRVREETPKRSHHGEDESDHSDLVCRADGKRRRVNPKVVATVRHRYESHGYRSLISACIGVLF